MWKSNAELVEPAARHKSSQGTRGLIPLAEMVQEGREPRKGKLHNTITNNLCATEHMILKRLCKHRDFLVVEWIRLCAPTAGERGFDPWSGT